MQVGTGLAKQQICFYRPRGKEFLREELHISRTLRDIVNISPTYETADSAVISPADEIQTRWDWKSWSEANLKCDECPDGYWITDIEGEIPPELSGTFFRNGPGWGIDSVAHPFDADGIVASISLSDGKAFFRSRFVDTRERILERTTGRPLFKGAFGTDKGIPSFLSFASRNASNTNVLVFKDKLWTLFDSAHPYELDPASLRTIGLAEERFMYEEGIKDGLQVLKSQPNIILDAVHVFSKTVSRLSPLGGARVTAHPRYDANFDRTILYTASYKPSDVPGNLITRFNFFEFDSQFNVKEKYSYDIEGFAFLHDFAVTKNYIVAIQNPIEMDFDKLLSGDECAMGCLRFRFDKRNKIHLIRRPHAPSYNKSTIVETPPSSVFHLGNAFEKDGNVVIDAVHYFGDPEYMLGPVKVDKSYAESYLETIPVPKLYRLEVSPAKQALINRTNICMRAMEFPSPNAEYQGKQYRYLYTSSGIHPYKNSNIQHITKIDLDTGKVKMWAPDASYFTGEPIFVQKPKKGALNNEREDNGWVIAFAFNGKTKLSELVILDAQRIEEGPVAVLKLKHSLPHGLHGTWTEKVYGFGLAPKN